MAHLSRHPPDVLMYGDMLPIEGCRTLRVLVSRKMVPLTPVTGKGFVKAWLERVRYTYIIILFRY